MSKPTNDFIGNSTAIDALLTSYTKPFMDYSGARPVCKVTQDQKNSLDEINRTLNGDATAMAGGIEAIGHLLAIGDYESTGLEQTQLTNLGWLLAHLGKQVANHQHMIDCLNGSLNSIESVEGCLK